MEDIVFFRKPIFTRTGKTFAYEFVLEEEQKAAFLSDANQDFDWRILGGGYPIFFNPPPIGPTDYWSFLPANCVLQVEFNPSLIKQYETYFRQIIRRGHKISLMNPCVEGALCAILDKVDFLECDYSKTKRSRVDFFLDKFKEQKGKLFIKGIETRLSFGIFRDLNFSYFQGDFYCEPLKNNGEEIEPAKVVLLRLMAQIQDPETSMDELERILSTDPPLCYRLLSYLNSANFGLLIKIDSIKRAVACLGLDPLKLWLSVILLSKVGGTGAEVFKTALIRGLMCQKFAEMKDADNSAPYFLTGLFSLLPAFADRPMTEVLEFLPLAKEIKNALLHQEGPIGEVLTYVFSYEQGKWEMFGDWSINKKEAAGAYRVAVEFTEKNLTFFC